MRNGTGIRDIRHRLQSLTMSVIARRGALLALSVMVLLLVRETRSLRDAAAAAEAERWSVTVGMYVPPFTAVAEDGRSLTVGQPGALAQLVVLFAAECEYSRRSVPAWNELAERIDPEGTGVVVAISTDREPGQVEAEGMTAKRFPTVRFPGRSYAAMYRSVLVPQTIIVDTAGRVRYARVGVLEGREAMDTVLTAWQRVSTRE
jgi:hypothetical protein